VRTEIAGRGQGKLVEDRESWERTEIAGKEQRKLGEYRYRDSWERTEKSGRRQRKAWNKILAGERREGLER